MADKTTDGIKKLQPSEMREMVKQVVNKVGNNLPKEQKMEQAKMLIKIFEEGMTPKEALGVTDGEIARIYCYAYRLFSAGLYQQAKNAFEALQSLEPFRNEFSLSLGVCHHRLQEYEKAIECYVRAGMLDKADPVPFFYAYDCLLRLDNDVLAYTLLLNSIKRAGDRPAYKVLVEKGNIIAEGLKKRIDERLAKEKAPA